MRHVIWVTGDSSGLGYAVCSLAQQRNHTVYGVSRSGHGDYWPHLSLDLASPDACLELAAEIRKSLPSTRSRVSLVHCAATIEPLGPAGHCEISAVVQNIMLNSVAPQLIGHALFRELRDFEFKGTLDLAMVSSSAPRNALPGWSGYVAGKAATNAWVACVAKEAELHDFRARVVSIEPGTIDTPMQALIRQTDEARFPERQRFEDLKNRSLLRSPLEVAKDLLLVLEGDLASDSHIVLVDRTDLRNDRNQPLNSVSQASAAEVDRQRGDDS